jgi:hypothetical protein
LGIPLYQAISLYQSTKSKCGYRRAPEFWRRYLLLSFFSSPRASFLAKRFVVFPYLFAVHRDSGEEICHFSLYLRRAPHFWRRYLSIFFISSPHTRNLAKIFVVSLYLSAAHPDSSEEICCFPLSLRRAPHFWRRYLLFSFFSSQHAGELTKIFVLFLYLFAGRCS